MDAAMPRSSKDASTPGPLEAALGKGMPGASPLHENGHSEGAAEGPEGSASKGNASVPHSIVQSQTGTGRASGDREGVGAMVVHSEPTGYVFIQTVDGDIEKVEKDVALLSPYVHREVNRHGRGYSRDSPVALPKQVSPAVLKLILEYCRFHRVSGRSDKERKIFDEKFIRLDTRVLCELTSAADSLDMKPLVDLTSRALARMIEGKTPEEIRETFHLPDDLTEEEKLEPVKNATDDPRIRLLNRLYARKRKELQDKKMTKQEIQDAAGSKKDNRSVEALLQFIDGSAGGKKSKSKKKKKKGKKEEADDHVSEDGSARGAVRAPSEENDDASVEAEELVSPRTPPPVGSQRQSGQRGHSRLGSWLGKSAGQDGLLPEQEGDGDELAAGKKDALESPRALASSDWTERMQEILALASSSQDRLQASLGGGTMPPPATPPARRRAPGDEDPIQAKLRTIQELHEQLRGSRSPSGGSEERPEEPPEKEENGLADVVVAAAAAAAEAAAAAAAAARDAAARCRSGGERTGLESGGGEGAGARLGRQTSMGSERTSEGGVTPVVERSRSADGARAGTGELAREEVSRREGGVPKGKGASEDSGSVEAGLASHNRAEADSRAESGTQAGTQNREETRQGAETERGAEEESQAGNQKRAETRTRAENGSARHRSHQPWTGIALLEAQQTAAFLQSFIRRVGFDPIVDVGMRGGVPGVELEDDHVAEQWAPDGRQMSMCVRLASGSIVSIAVAKPPPPERVGQHGS
ncbi:hypothetical protein KFL_007740060 [Klebsormidium nitens]|uniref:SKP1 component dimerisation domain-containing protein n=1 Tax=Klebsormidium nitens TaxID=105231 RepID=A0A1Y1IKZ9_KLENI|nr:hypothetical protein KFL_007740060 [Klebsormidium nitens]|eukprot:GAQ91373.1 hypothetical protein KFL_007740060 [Klebsormidium nitens]